MKLSLVHTYNIPWWAGSLAWASLALLGFGLYKHNATEVNLAVYMLLVARFGVSEGFEIEPEDGE